MTQTPLEAEEAAGTLAAGADLDAAPAAASEQADVTVAAGPVSLRTRIAQTPRGQWAVAGLVTGVLLGAALIVWVSTAPARRHPWATAWTLRR